MSARDSLLHAARRARVARLASAASVAVGLAAVLLMLAPDRDQATRAVARTRHAAPAAGVPVTYRSRRVGFRPRRVVLRPPRRPSKLPQAVVTLAPRALTIPVPASYLGISTEYWTLPLFERYGTLLDRALSLLEVPGEGPLMLRIGGDSADHVFWAPHARRASRWRVDLGPHWLNQVSALVRHLNARVILDLNLITDSPLTAEEWADAAYRSLPPGSLAGFEVGNEPDLYARRYWRSALKGSALAMALLPKDLSPAIYVRDFGAYARTLAQVAPRVPVVGPAAANPASDLTWVSTLLASPHPRLGEVSGHAYPYSACSRPHAATYPTISRVLSENGSVGIANRLRRAIALAHRAGLPFRLTEINSVTCGGTRGVSDTFATALWAPDALFAFLRAGVQGVNVHVRARAVNAAFSLGRGGMVARPLLYGLLLFDRTIGPSARLVPTRVAVPTRGARGAHLKVWAVRAGGGGLRVLLIDKGVHSVSVDLRFRATGPATIERLLAPSVRSRSGVTLAGQHIGRDGLWHGVPQTETVRPGPSGYVVTVPRMSAALVRMRLPRRSGNQ